MSTNTLSNTSTENITGKPGPRTPEGKAISSLNAVKEGLFATHDFIRLGERDEYDRLAAAFRHQFDPEGPVEELYTTEIIGANWRLRRCRLVEEDLSARYDEIDPIQDGAGDKIQRSVDRARAQAHSVIRRALAEMRKLQTERHIRAELSSTYNYGLGEFTKIVQALTKYLPPPSPEPEEAETASAAPATDSFCKPAPRPASPASPSTAPEGICPCGSGLEPENCCCLPDLMEPKLAA